MTMPDEALSDEHVVYPPSMLIPNDNASDLPLHDRLLHLFVSHFFRPIGLKHTTVHPIDYWFMHQVQVDNMINLHALIFQNLIKVV